MAASQNIIRGMFRLSIVAATLAAAYGAYDSWQVAEELSRQRSDIIDTLECGSRKGIETLKPFENEFGLVDLTKVGCSSKSQFLVSYDELSRAREGKFTELLEDAPPVFNTVSIGFLALAAFLIVNLLGLAFIGARTVVRWVTEGFEPRA
jgi:hypothetical protein